MSTAAGTSVGHIDLTAGFPSAAAQPLAKDSARNGQIEPAPARLTPIRPTVIAASMPRETSSTSLREKRSAMAPAGKREQQQRQELRKPDEAEVERVPRDVVDLPPDRDEHHLAREPVGERAAQQQRVVALPKRGWPSPPHRTTERSGGQL